MNDLPALLYCVGTGMRKQIIRRRSCALLRQSSWREIIFGFGGTASRHHGRIARRYRALQVGLHIAFMFIDAREERMALVDTLAARAALIAV